MNYELNYTNVTHEIADSKHNLTIELNIGKVERDGGYVGHDFGDVGAVRWNIENLTKGIVLT